MTAVTLPFGIQSYKRADLPEVRLVNTYVEQVPIEPLGPLVLLPRPALSPVKILGAGPINALFFQQGALGDNTLTVSGNAVYSQNTMVGNIDNPGLVQVVAVDGAVLIATGGDLWRCDGISVTAIAFPDNQSVTWIAYAGGYALAGVKGSRHVYFTLDATTWDGLDYFSAEQSTEYTVGGTILIDQLMVLCTQHTELFYLTGDSDAPFQRVQQRVFDKGARSRDTIARLDNTVFWVGHDNVVYRAENTPIRISDHGIEERLAATDAVSAWAYPWKGHLFYVLQMDEFTAVFDVATKQFHEAASFKLPRWRGRCGILVNGKVMVGDDVTGQIWTLTDDVLSDGTAPIVREFTATVNSPGFLDNVTLTCSPPASEIDGLIELRTSRDSGNSWSDWRQSNLGVVGQNRKRVGFKRFGLVDSEGLILQFRITDPIPTRISRITANEGQGGRSRPV